MSSPTACTLQNPKVGCCPHLAWPPSSTSQGWPFPSSGMFSSPAASRMPGRLLHCLLSAAPPPRYFLHPCPGTLSWAFFICTISSGPLSSSIYARDSASFSRRVPGLTAECRAQRALGVSLPNAESASQACLAGAALPTASRAAPFQSPCWSKCTARHHPPPTTEGLWPAFPDSPPLLSSRLPLLP